MKIVIAAFAGNQLLRSLGPLAAWSLFVWVTRIRNIWTDDELSNAGQAGRLAIAGIFSVGGLMVAALILRRARRQLQGYEPFAVAIFAIFTMVYWVARDAQILTNDHSAGFKIVHLVLGVISFVVAVRALRFIIRKPQPSVVPAS